MEKQVSYGSKSLLPSIHSMSIYGGTQKTKLPLLNTRDTSPSRANWEVFRFSSSDRCPATVTCLASTQALRSRRVSSASKHLGTSDQGGQTTPPGRLDRLGQSDRPRRSDHPSWAVEPAWVATPPRRVFDLGFVAQPSNPVVFW
jgi:hypothetical protein